MEDAPNRLPNKTEIKEWLKFRRHDRDWLATKLGVTPKTVDNWLSSAKNIPELKLGIIKELMELDEREAELQSDSPPNQLFSVEVDLDTFRRYNRASLKDGITMEEWVIQELNRAANEAPPTDDESEAKRNAFGYKRPDESPPAWLKEDPNADRP